MLALSGYVAHVDAGPFGGCGSCAGACPFGAISLDEGYNTVGVGARMGCGFPSPNARGGPSPGGVSRPGASIVRACQLRRPVVG
jgi:Fe-S-cluster-containing hydrogenase component 2